MTDRATVEDFAKRVEKAAGQWQKRLIDQITSQELWEKAQLPEPFLSVAMLLGVRGFLARCKVMEDCFLAQQPEPIKAMFLRLSREVDRATEESWREEDGADGHSG